MSNREKLVERSWERKSAPEALISLSLKSTIGRDELAARAWEREAAPEALISLLLKSKIVKK